MHEITNDERCDWAMALFNTSPYDEDTEDSSLVDILTDLMHLCKREGWDFDEKVRTARMHFEAEGSK